MKKVIVLLIILMMAGVVIAVDTLPEGWTLNSNTKVTDDQNRAYTQAENGMFIHTKDTTKITYNPKTGTQVEYHVPPGGRIQQQYAVSVTEYDYTTRYEHVGDLDVGSVAFVEKNQYSKDDAGFQRVYDAHVYNEPNPPQYTVGEGVSEPLARPSSPAPTPGSQGPTGATQPTPTPISEPAPTPTPAQQAGVAGAQGTAGEQQAGVGGAQGATGEQQAGVAGAQGTAGEQIKEDVPPATGTQPKISIIGGAGPEEEKVAEGKPEEKKEEPEEKKPKKTIIVEGGKEEEAAGTKEKGATKYYVDSDNNVYTTDTNKPYDKDDKEVPESIANAAKTYGKITNVQGSTYTFKQQVDVDDGLEADYKTTTEVSITTRDDGSYTRTVDQKTDERTGLLERGEWKFVERTEVSTTVGRAKNKEGETVNAMTERSYTSYDKNNKQGLTSTVGYEYSDRWGKVYQTSANVIGADGKNSWSIDKDGKETYYDKNGKPVTSRSDAELTREERKEIDKRSVEYVNNGGASGLFSAMRILGTARSLGRFMKAYDEYAGLRQYSAIGGQAYDQQVQERRAKIQQEFCIATGTRNCIVSKICEQKFDIVPGDTMAGRGPGGQFVTSARINGKRSLAVELEGLSRQQLIDMFGNLTVVSGRRINLTDPKFNPKTLEKLKLRLYHIQFLITNNADKHELSYNIKFKRSEPGSTSSYGTPVKEAKWYPADKKLEKGATTTDEIYKWSPGEYTDVCLTFSPPLPSGSITGKPKMVNEFCVPFKEDYEGPTTIAASLQEAMAQGEQEQVTGVAGELV